MATYKEERFYFGEADVNANLPYCARFNINGLCIEDSDFDCNNNPFGNFILLPHEDLKDFIAFLQSSL